MKTEVERLIDRVRGDPSYVTFLLVERPYIRSALLARGTPLDEVDRTLSYSTSIGNALHDDLIELEMWLDTLSPTDRELLLLWANKEERPPSFGRAAIRRVRTLIKAHARKQEHADGTSPSRPDASLPLQRDVEEPTGIAQRRASGVPDMVP